MSLTKILHLLFILLLFTSCGAFSPRKSALDQCVREYIAMGLYADEAVNVCNFIYKRNTPVQAYP